MANKNYIIPIFVPHRGCPNDCVFCNQKKITGLSTEITALDVKKQIDSYLSTITEYANIEVAFYGGSFTAIDMATQAELLQVACEYKELKKISKIRLSTRPDCIDIERLDLLSNFKVDIIELGVQSLSSEVLNKSLRGHTVDDVITAVELIRRYGFTLGLQMMVGLPTDSKERSIITAREIIKLKPDFIRIYPTLVVKDTQLEDMYNKGSYNALRLDEAIDICVDLSIMFRFNNIPIIRIGLQPTENINLNKDVIAGPFHPAFRQMVESSIYKKILYYALKAKNITDCSILITINSKEISNLVGQKSENLNYIKTTFNIKDLKVVKSDVPKDFFHIIGNGFSYKIHLQEFDRQYLSENNLLDA